MREQPLLLLLALSLPAQAPDPAPDATTRLEGLVLDPLSQPVANARITVEVDGDVIARTQTDGLGTFVVGKVPARTVVVRATTAGPDVGATAVDLFRARCGFARFHVMPARQVSGTVRDPAGNAIAGAWVVCTPRGHSAAPFGGRDAGFAGSHTLSDADGRYVLSHVPFGRIALRAWAPGAAGFAADVDGTADAAVDCTLPAGPPQQRSFEIVDATPAQIATARIHVAVFADGSELLLPPRLRVPGLDATGRREVRGWPLADEVRARVELAGACVVPTTTSIEANAPDILNKSFRFAADDVAFVRGIVVGDDGPSAGLQLVAEACTFLEDPAAPRTLGTTARDGTFMLTSPVARNQIFRLRCVDPAFVLRRKNPARLPLELRTGAVQPHTPSERHDLLVERATTVRCALREEGGAPVAGAVVALLGPGRLGGVFTDFLAQGHSGIDGTVELHGLDLRDGEHVTCQIRAPRGFLERAFTVTSDHVQDLGTLSLGAGATLRVAARTAAGLPLPGARIYTRSASGLEWQLVATDRNGNCRLLGLLPEKYDVSIVGQMESWRDVQIATGEVTEVELKAAQ